MKRCGLLGVGVAVGGQPHELVFAAVDLEAAVVGEGRIEQAQGVGKLELPQDGELPAPAEADGGGGPFPHPVHREDGGLGKGRRIEGGGGVGQVVFREKDRGLAVSHLGQFFLEQGAHQELFFDPHRHGHQKAPEPPGGKPVVGLQQALELEVGLVIEGHGAQVGEPQARLRHDIGQGIGREGGVVLLAGEPLLLGRGDDLAVHQEGGGAVVIKGGETENRFGQPVIPLKDGVDEGGDGRTAGKDHQGAEKQQRQDDGQQPKFFPDLEEAPQILERNP